MSFTLLCHPPLFHALCCERNSSTALNSSASTLPTRNCNNSSITTCSYSNKRSTRRRASIGRSLTSAWICSRVSNWSRRYSPHSTFTETDRTKRTWEKRLKRWGNEQRWKESGFWPREKKGEQNLFDCWSVLMLVDLVHARRTLNAYSYSIISRVYFFFLPFVLSFTLGRKGTRYVYLVSFFYHSLHLLHLVCIHCPPLTAPMSCPLLSSPHSPPLSTHPKSPKANSEMRRAQFLLLWFIFPPVESLSSKEIDKFKFRLESNYKIDKYLSAN